MSRPAIYREGQEFWLYTRAGDWYEVPSKIATVEAVDHALLRGTITSGDRLDLLLQLMCLNDLPDQEDRWTAPSDQDEEHLVDLIEGPILDDEQLERHVAEVHALINEIVRLYEANTPTTMS